MHLHHFPQATINSRRRLKVLPPRIPSSYGLITPYVGTVLNSGGFLSETSFLLSHATRRSLPTLLTACLPLCSPTWSAGTCLPLVLALSGPGLAPHQARFTLATYAYAFRLQHLCLDPMRTAILQTRRRHAVREDSTTTSHPPLRLSSQLANGPQSPSLVPHASRPCLSQPIPLSELERDGHVPLLHRIPPLGPEKKKANEAPSILADPRRLTDGLVARFPAL